MAVGEAGRAHFQMYAADARSDVHWRLLSANNRDLGRGVVGYRDPESCLLSIKLIVISLDGLEMQVRRRESSEWRWTLGTDGEAIVVGAHGYDRQVRCHQAVRQFLDCASTASVSPAVVVSGARRWGTASSALAAAPVRTRPIASARLDISTGS
ncbi:MAG: hypothetical protein JO147_08875 [Actinobacteria bacterium]|nr:hypothetical protein [Actinomycetota bacterium]